MSSVGGKPPGRPFRPGQSGNPGGRPRGIEKMVRETIAARVAQDPINGQIDGWHALALHLYEIAMGCTEGAERDQIAAAKLLYERAYGRPREFVKIETDINAAGVDDGAIDWNKLTAVEGDALERALEKIVDGGDDDSPVH